MSAMYSISLLFHCTIPSGPPPSHTIPGGPPPAPVDPHHPQWTPVDPHHPWWTPTYPGGPPPSPWTPTIPGGHLPSPKRSQTSPKTRPPSPKLPPSPIFPKRYQVPHLSFPQRIPTSPVAVDHLSFF